MSEPFKLDFAPANDRRFLRADFKDRNGDECSIQESSLATEECVWLGLNEGTHHHLTGDCLARMHLNREQARQIALALLGFAETGKLGDGGEGAPQNLQDRRADRHRKTMELLAAIEEKLDTMLRELDWLHPMDDDELDAYCHALTQWGLGKVDTRPTLAEYGLNTLIPENILAPESEPTTAPAIIKTLTNQQGQPFAVYLSDGMKIGIERDSGAAWLRIEPAPTVREAGGDET